MSSLRRIQASRANGALSRGPVTPEGKARSARNALRHGILARTLVLPDESSDAFRAALAAYVERFCPVDDVELGFIEEMATTFWRQRRCWGVETRMIEDAASSAGAPDALGRLAQAFEALATTPHLSLVHRYEVRLHRMFQRALQNFLVLREYVLPNEPSPISGHPADPLPLPSPPTGPDPAPSGPALAPDLSTTPPLPNPPAQNVDSAALDRESPSSSLPMRRQRTSRRSSRSCVAWPSGKTSRLLQCDRRPINVTIVADKPDSACRSADLSFLWSPEPATLPSEVVRTPVLVPGPPVSLRNVRPPLLGVDVEFHQETRQRGRRLSLIRGRCGAPPRGRPM